MDLVASAWREGQVTVRIDPRQIGYDEDRTNEFYKTLQRRVAAWPDVASLAVAFTTPMSYLIGGGYIYIEGRPMARVLSRFLPLVDATDWITFGGVAAGPAVLGCGRATYPRVAPHACR